MRGMPEQRLVLKSGLAQQRLRLPGEEAASPRSVACSVQRKKYSGPLRILGRRNDPEELVR